MGIDKRYALGLLSIPEHEKVSVLCRKMYQEQRASQSP